MNFGNLRYPELRRGVNDKLTVTWNELLRTLEHRDALVDAAFNTVRSSSVQYLTGSDSIASSTEVAVFTIGAASVATLPDPTTTLNFLFKIVNDYNSTDNLTFSENINGNGAFSLAPSETVQIMSNGTEYLQI